jgi:hypothetical protein
VPLGRGAHQFQMALPEAIAVTCSAVNPRCNHSWSELLTSVLSSKQIGRFSRRRAESFVVMCAILHRIVRLGLSCLSVGDAKRETLPDPSGRLPCRGTVPRALGERAKVDDETSLSSRSGG